MDMDNEQATLLITLRRHLAADIIICHLQFVTLSANAQPNPMERNTLPLNSVWPIRHSRLSFKPTLLKDTTLPSLYPYVAECLSPKFGRFEAFSSGNNNLNVSYKLIRTIS
ncbi:hypothetical protein J6590_076677 [Homalodisca vitripennis]|nr:hypothetical protein J6590_076677 [Homalodisca vitripennis]